MELNSSFYAYPTRRNCELWEQQLGEIDFPFVVKLHQDFTHLRELGEHQIAERASAFLSEIKPLKSSGRLRGLLVQFPFSFDRSKANRRHLGRVVAALEGERLILELRHRSWFEDEPLAKFQKQQLSVATVDMPFSSDHPPKSHLPTGPIGYLRLHGRNSEHWFRAESGRDDRYNYLYSEPEVEDLCETAKRLASEHDEVFVVTNNHFEGQAIANAIEVRARLAGKPQLAPATLLNAFPQLGPWAKEDGPPSLFT